jgi:hypothetical protein
VVVSGGFGGDGDMLTADSTGTAITATYDSANETLTLSGSDTAADYTAVLDSVTFRSLGFDANNAGANDTRTVSDGSNDGSLSNMLSPTTTIQIGSPAVDDYFGAGTSDILFREDSTGAFGIEQMSNGAIASWQPAVSNAAYVVVGSGDFTGAGTSDILFRDNATGDTGYDTIVNGEVTGWHDIGGSSTAYSVVAVGDYAGNGTSDILFQDSTTGDTGYYAISNGAMTGWHDLVVSPTTYHVAS